MDHADEQWSRCLLASMNNVLRLATEHGVRRNLDLVLRLYQTYAVSAGLYAGQVWSTPFLQADRVFLSKVQIRHCSFLRHLSKVGRASNWCLLHELGQKPFQLYWWRMVARFWNKSIQGNDNPVFKVVLKSNVSLARAGCKDCWCAQVNQGLQSIGATDLTITNINQSLPWDIIQGRVEDNYASFWAQFEDAPDFREEDVPKRKTLTYFQCFKREEVLPPVPGYFRLAEASRGEIVNMARFKLGSHGLRVETGLREGLDWRDRFCERCSFDHIATLDCFVDDEYHMIYDCEKTAYLRANPTVRRMLDNSHGSIRSLFSENGDKVDLLRYISDCMKVVDMYASPSSPPD